MKKKYVSLFVFINAYLFNVISTHAFVISGFSMMDQSVNFQNFLNEYQYEIIINMFLLCVIIVFLFRRNHKQLLDQLNYDSLTGVLTEKKFMEQASLLLMSSNNDYTLVSFDIDNFKYLNETIGYHNGTRLIQLMAEHIVKTYGESTLVCRVYGDQFLILTDKKIGIKPICGRDKCVGCITDALKEVLVNETILKTSVGIYPITNRDEPLSYMIDCASLARRLGKDTYGHTRIVFDKEMEKELTRKNQTLASMEKAIKENEFYPLFQPKYCLKTNAIIGGEALVRWNYQGKQVPPDHFIPLFEQNGFVKHVDFFVLEEVCKMIKELESPIKIAVNFSGATILEENFAFKVRTLIAMYGIDPKYIEVEITEGVFSKNFEEMSDLVEKLREVGISVAMDDFGSGVSSLNRLKNLDFDVLKIDKEFLDDSLDTKEGLAIVEAIIKMAKALNLIVVAEGVETHQQSVRLNELGCDIGQGYFYSKPVSKQDFITLCTC